MGPELPGPSPAALDELASVFRDEAAKAIATLVRLCGDIDVAEEAVQEAFLVAARIWPERGVPPNPAGWLVTTARNRAIDRLRRESTRSRREQHAAELRVTDDPREVGPLHDDRLRLIFTCCHPALSPDAQVALTLRLLGGLQTDEIARAFLQPEATVAQRIVRAKRKIRDAKILQLYDQLLDLQPTAVVRLNRAVALAEVQGPARALREVDQLAETLDDYHLLHVTRAELLRRLGRAREAEAAYGRAAELTRNGAERELIETRRRSLGLAQR